MMSSIKKPKVRMDQAFKIHKFMLSTFGVWPVKNPTFLKKLSLAFAITVFCMAYSLMLFEAFYIFGDFASLSKSLYTTVSYTSYLAKLMGILANKETFIAMLESIEDPIFYNYSDEIKDMDQAVKLCNIIAKIFLCGCFNVFILYTTTPLFDHQETPTHLSFDLRGFGPHIYVLQVVNMVVSTWINATFDILIQCFYCLASTQFEILRKRIINVREDALKSLRPILNDVMVLSDVLEGDDLDEDVDRVVEDTMKNIIQHHEAVMQFTGSIQKIFAFGVLCQFLASVLCFCNTAFIFLLVNVKSLQFAQTAVYFVVMVGELMIYCWFGHNVILKSAGMREACYMSNWLSLNPRIRKYHYMIMERSKRPMTITVYNWCNVSLDTFSSIIQWSYSYFALLHQLYIKSTRNNAVSN